MGPYFFFQGMIAMIPAMITIAFASTVRYTYIALTLYSFGKKIISFYGNLLKVPFDLESKHHNWN